MACLIFAVTVTPIAEIEIAIIRNQPANRVPNHLMPELNDWSHLRFGK
jgi:hypothetical protein